MIKKFEAFNELDPYGEENWEEGDGTKDIDVLREIAIRLNLNPTEIEQDLKDCAYCFEFNTEEWGWRKEYGDFLKFSVSSGSIWWDKKNVMSLIDTNCERFTMLDEEIKEISKNGFVDACVKIAKKLK